MAYDWIHLFPAHHPSIRGQYAMSWDGTQIMLFSGTDRVSALDDETWTWDGTDWTLQSPAHSPSGRWSAGIAYDIGNNEVVLFGGSTVAASEVPNGETWVWNGTDWTQKFPAHSPPARVFAQMAYDEVRGEVVLFSGTDGISPLEDTWTWDGTDWTQLTPAHNPTGDPFETLAWDEANGLVVMWGGVDASKTWTWDGTDWTAESPAHQPSSGGSIFDQLPGLVDWRIGGKVLEFGGRSIHVGTVYSSGTWTWDGTDWTHEAPLHAPSARADMSLAYDFARKQVVLFGGLDFASNNVDDTWIYADIGPFTLHLET